jgi:ribose transport system substrate-binding protein
MLFVVVLLSIIAGSQHTATAEKIHIGRVMYDLNHAYQQSDLKHFERRCKENNIDITFIDGQAQNEIIVNAMEDLIAKGVDGIIVQPHDPDAINGVVREAHEAGIPVLCFFNKASEVVTPFVPLAESELAFEMGQIVARKWLEAHPDTPIVIATLDIPMVPFVHDGRTMPFVNGVQSVAPDAQHVISLMGGGVRDKAYTVTEDILESHPEVNIMFGHNANDGLGALAAFEAAGRGNMEEGKPVTELFASFDGTEQEALKIADPTSSYKITVALQPDNTAGVLFDTIMKMINGEIGMHDDVSIPAPDTIVNGWEMSIDELQQFISHEYFSKVDLKKELGL